MVVSLCPLTGQCIWRLMPKGKTFCSDKCVNPSYTLKSQCTWCHEVGTMHMAKRLVNKSNIHGHTPKLDIKNCDFQV